MAVKAVFFDWFNTLSGYETSREQLYQQAFAQQGMELDIRTIYRGVQRGDRYYFSQSAPPLKNTDSLEDKTAYYSRYPQFICDEAAIELSSEQQMTVLKEVLSRFSARLRLYPDSLSTVEILKNRGLITGVITNADSRAVKMIADSAVGSLMDIVVTSEEAKAEKPEVAIFRKALTSTGIRSEESIFCGDQYHNDIVGANNAGMKAVLIDRFNVLEDGPDYIRIKNLEEILPLL
jgi:HAD superfamily hydrolase (TIGR01549 family)